MPSPPSNPQASELKSLQNITTAYQECLTSRQRSFEGSKYYAMGMALGLSVGLLSPAQWSVSRRFALPGLIVFGGLFADYFANQKHCQRKQDIEFEKLQKELL